MKPEEESRVWKTLNEFAEKRLNAAAYKDCTHRFRLIRCEQCSGMVAAVEIERHRGDRRGDFMGIVRTTCAECGAVKDILSMTSGNSSGKPRTPETPKCRCGATSFCIGYCERWEDWGFFDEGTLVAMCSECGKCRALVDTD